MRIHAVPPECPYCAAAPCRCSAGDTARADAAPADDVDVPARAVPLPPGEQRWATWWGAFQANA